VGGNSVDEVLSVSILDNRLMMAGQTSSSADLVINGTYDPTLNTPPDGFLVAVDTDITPPLVGMVYDRPQDDNTFTDIGTQTSRDSLSANWSDFMDPESGIERYEWALGTSPGAQDVSPFTPISVSLQRSFTKTGLSLTVGTTYYATVRAINGAGNTAMASSNGVRVVAPGTDGGTGNTDGGTGNTDGGTDGGMEQPGQGDVPLMGWSCSAGAGLPVFLGLLAVVFLARRRGPPVQSPRE
jgi:hypothetical protein